MSEIHIPPEKFSSNALVRTMDEYKKKYQRSLDDPDAFWTEEAEQFVQLAFSHVGLDWHDYVVIDPRFFRPAEAGVAVADATKAKGQLGWEPEVDLEELVAMMVDTDLAELSASLEEAGDSPPVMAA